MVVLISCTMSPVLEERRGGGGWAGCHCASFHAALEQGPASLVPARLLLGIFPRTSGQKSRECDTVPSDVMPLSGSVNPGVVTPPHRLALDDYNQECF